MGNSLTILWEITASSFQHTRVWVSRASVSQPRTGIWEPVSISCLQTHSYGRGWVLHLRWLTSSCPSEETAFCVEESPSHSESIMLTKNNLAHLVNLSINSLHDQQFYSWFTPQRNVLKPSRKHLRPYLLQNSCIRGSQLAVTKCTAQRNG